MMILSTIYSLLLLQFLPAVLALLVLVALVVVLLMNRVIVRRVRQGVEYTASLHDIMEKALKISANNVIIYDINKHYTTKLYGHMLPDEGISDEDWKKHVHPDDLPGALDMLHQMISGKLKMAEFNYRWNFDYSGGKPRWGYLHNTSVAEYIDGVALPVGIISVLVDETRLHEQQQQEEDLSNKYQQIFENSIIGLSFYSPDGWLIDANQQMRAICNFDSDEGDAFFSTVNLFDIPPFSEVIDRHNITEYWGCSLSVVPERNMYVYLEIRLHPILDAEGNLVYLSIAARDITEERELYLQQKLNDAQIQKANEEIQLYETELRYMMENTKMQAWRISLDRNCIEYYSGLSTIVRTFSLEDMKKIFVNQDDDFVRALSNPAEALSKPLVYVCQIYPVVTQSSTEKQWVQINCIPEYDKQGRLLGSFGVWRNITDMMRKQEQLKRETERANDSGHQKSVFLANMTHEIRTPLNAIVGFSDLLQAIETPDEKREMIRIIHNNCDMLLRLIDDILVLSNVDANAMQIRPEEVDFAAEFSDICQSLAQRVQNPAVEFLCDNPCPSLMVCIDKRRIQQVITNFVTNAVKYTQQGHIRVGYRQEERQGRQGLYVYCEDTGAGIPEDQQSRVFERFVKLNDFIQGTGLGLSICKAIIERSQGEIGLESEFGKGSTFWFWIPV